MTDITETTWLDSTAQSDLVRRDEVIPQELIETATARIEAVKRRLDAVIRTQFDAARREADGDPPDGPFRGVPILFEDTTCTVAGEPTPFGIGPLRDMPWPVTSYLAELSRPPGFVALSGYRFPADRAVTAGAGRAEGALFLNHSRISRRLG